MQFTLQTLLLSFVVVASAMAAFGWGGPLVAAVILAVVAYIRGSKSPKSALMSIFVLLVFGSCVLGFLALPRPGSRGTHPRADCMNNMKRISHALHAYHDDHGRFPPACVLGPDGKPWHSWRTLILPYLGWEDTYDQYRFDEPWNGPNNRKLASSYLHPFMCLSNANSTPGGTNYVAVVGPQTVWPGPDSVSLDDVKDKPETTILLVEIEDSDISWAEPRDVSFAEICGDGSQAGAAPALGRHPDPSYFYQPEEFTNVALVDASTHSVKISMPSDAWRALLTRDGGEEIDIDHDWGEDARRLHWGHIGGLICLALSTALLLLRPVRRRDEAKTPDEADSGTETETVGQDSDRLQSV
jgi:hypothetical protein